MAENIPLAIILTLIVAVMNSVGFVLQRKGQTLIPAKYSGLKLIIESIKTPTWLIGFLFVIGKMPLYIYSISIGSLSVIQPFNATAILFLVIFGILYLKETLSQWEIFGIIALTVGTLVIGFFYPPSALNPTADWGGATLFLLVCVGICVLLLFIKHKNISMAFISGITMAMAVVFVKLISVNLESGINLLDLTLDKQLVFGIIGSDVNIRIVSAMFYGAVIAIIISLASLLFAFRAGKALLVAPIELVSSIIMPVFAGFWIFSESINIPLIFGIFLSLAGTILLSGVQVRLEEDIKKKGPAIQGAGGEESEGGYKAKPPVPRPGMAKKNNVIIGAGPAGLSSSYELSRHGLPCIVLEKQDKTGGICKTHEFEYEGEKYLTDTGPHRFFSKNPALYQMIEDLLGPDWVEVKRLTRQLINGKYYDYPVNVAQAVMNAGPDRALRMGLDFLVEMIKGRFREPDKSTFESWVVANFGRSLAEFNLLNYTEKIWGIPCSKIAGEWAAQRIPGMNALSIVKKAIFKSGGPKSMIDAFFYPRRGINMIYAAMEKVTKGKGNSVLTNVKIMKIKHANGLVTSLEYEVNGARKAIPVDNLISSMPITELIELLDPQPPAEVLKASRGLQYRDQVYLFLIIDKPKITEDTWIYFPTTPPTFGRMMEPKNWTKDMSPARRSSLFVEYFAFKGDALWRMSKENLVKMTVRQLEWLGFCKASEVLDAHVIYNEKAYPSWDIYFRKKLTKINNYLTGFPNIYTVGRNGRFRYNNQDHSIETGLLAAKSIIEEQNYDLEAAGAELEYFESGKLYQKKPASMPKGPQV